MQKNWLPLALLLWSSGSLIHAESLIRPQDRIVFIGDSITGQGGKGEGGWVALFGQALKAHDAANKQTLVPLGGSGQTVGSWGNIERKSRTTSQILDVKPLDAQTELGKPANVVVIMLGMNDVLAPSLKDEPAGYAKWIADYRSLIRAVRERTSPRVLALGTPTPCTEDPASPKNQVMDRMSAELQKLAAEENCIILPTRAAAWEMLDGGRQRNPSFHINSDQVHPNSFGHAAIAVGMLRGLGETEAAQPLFASTLDKAEKHKLSWEVALEEGEPLSEASVLQLRVFHDEGKVTVDLPPDWKLEETKEEKGETVLRIRAILDRIENRFTIRAGGESAEISVPALWLVASGNVGWQGWKSGVFDPVEGRLLVDELVRTGADWPKTLAGMELKPGVPLRWNRFLGNVSYGGGGAPGAIDFAQITYFNAGHAGYGLRWIYSDHEREVSLKIAKLGFAGTPHLQVWLNGADVYTGDPAKAKDRELSVKLNKGWNLLSFKSNFQQWQWQFAIDLEGKNGDQLADLRYSAAPR